MTWVPARELLQYAHKKRFLACVSVYNLETIQAVVKAAEQENAPVMLSIGNEAIAHAGLDALGSAAIRAARAASVPATVHLNHSRSLDLIMHALDLGFGSVMFDGSRLPYVENARLTRRAVKLGHAAGVLVEGELGPLSGPIRGAGTMDVEHLAHRFVHDTDVDLLALSIPPGGLKNLNVLKSIAMTLPCPVAIHGADSLGPDGAAQVHALGARKVNFHSGVKRAMLEDIKRTMCEEDATQANPTLAYEALHTFVRGILNGKSGHESALL